MSRSFHTNRRLIERVSRFRRPTQQRREELQRLWDEVYEKRLAMRDERARRRTRDAQDLAVAPQTLPIHVWDESGFVRYPANVEDLRVVMRALPVGQLAGVREIHLTLGLEACREDIERERASVTEDPHVRRISVEWLPGVFMPTTRGLYHSRQNQLVLDIIQVHATVYAPDLENRAMWELVLRAQCCGRLCTTWDISTTT